MGSQSPEAKSVSVGPELDLTYYIWRPEGQARGGVLMLHGYGDHACRFSDLARYLAEHGFLVVGPDARGHGKSSGRRGHVLRFDQYVEDLEAIMQGVRAQAPDIRDWFVLGHSMGGLVALRFALRHGDEYRGVIVSNPLLELAMKVPIVKRWLGQLASSIVPALTLSNGLDPEALSRDPAISRAYVADPLVHQVATARWFTEMQKAREQTLQEAASSLNLPTLFLLSTGDRIVDVSAAKGLFERMSGGAKELKIYPGGYHEIFNDFDRDQAFADVVGWLERQVQEKANRA